MEPALRHLGEIEVALYGLSAGVEPANPIVPKQTPGGVRIVVNAGGQSLSAGEVARLLGGSFQVRAELSGPGLPAPLSLPLTGADAVPSPDPLVLTFPGLPHAGEYDLANIRLVREGRAVLDVSPRRVTLRVIEQILVTSVVTRPLSRQEILDRGVVLDSSSYLGFEFAIVLHLESEPVLLQFPVVFDREGVALPLPLQPPPEPLRSLVTAPELVPVLLRPVPPEDEPDGAVLGTEPTDGGMGDQGGVPSLLVIPGSVGYLKQFFSAILIVGNGAPSGSGLVVRDVTGRLEMPPGDDGVLGTEDDPLALPVLEAGPQSPTLALVGADGSSQLQPGEFAQGELTLRGEREGRHDVDFVIEAKLDGLPIGPVPLGGRAHGAVLVRNAYFDMTFTVPTVVRADEEFSVLATITNIGQGVGQDVKVTMDPARLSGARLLSEGTQTIAELPAGDSRTLEYRFRSEVTGEVVASYLRFDTDGGVDVTGRLNFRIGVGERGVVMSPDTLILPSTVRALPSDVVRAAMRVLGQAWSAARAPTLPPGVERPATETVYSKGVSVAEAGLRVELGQPLADALRDLLLDFHGGGYDPGFDQVLRETSAGAGFDSAIAAAIDDAVGSDVLAYHDAVAEIAASGRPFLSFAIENAGSGALPGGIALIDGAGRRTDRSASRVPTSFVLPLGSAPERSRLGWLSALDTPPYVLQIDGDAAGAMNLSLTVPGPDGEARHLRLDGIDVSLGTRVRLIYNPENGSEIDLEIDAAGDGSYEQKSQVATTALTTLGPQLVSAATIGPETLAGVSGFGTHAALLFDRVVSAEDAAEVAHYEIPLNSVVAARRQLSGRLVFVALEQPEGPLVPSSLAVEGIRDERGSGGLRQELALGSRLTSPGAVVSGRVLEADGTPVADALVTYGNSSGVVTAMGCEGGGISGVAAQRTDASGRFTFRYVRQDGCGRSFRMETQDPTTGAVRGVKTHVRTNGQTIALDIVLIGHGTVTGTVRHADQSVAANARVRVVSVTDSQIGYVAMTDSQGVYTIERMTVGAVTATAVSGANLGRGAGRLDVAGGTTTVDITLDGNVDIRGSVRKLENGVLSAVPGVDVVYYRSGQPLGLSVTDEHGQYRLLGVPAGPYRLEAGLNYRDKTSLEGNSIAGQQLVQNLVIEVLGDSSYGTVRGTVRLQSGARVAGAWVSDDVVAALADEMGRYELSGVAVGAYSRTITGVSPDGRRSGTTSVLVNLAGQVVENADIELSGLGAAVFQVVDDQGAAVPGATVGLQGMCLNPCGCRFTTTDAQGLARFDSLPFGSAKARAVVATSPPDSAEGTALVTSEDAPAGGLLPLGGFGTVSGSVSNPDGTPAHGAVVRLSALTFVDGVWQGNRVCRLVSYPRTATTDTAGHFEFANVHAGSVEIEAWSDFHPEHVQASGAVAARSHREFVLQLAESPDTIAGVLSGTVWLPDGTAGAGPDVTVTASGTIGDVSVRTVEEGRFSFARVLPAGSYLLTARDDRPDGTGSVAQMRVALLPVEPSSHDLRLKNHGPVSVSVVDGSGDPVEGGVVTVVLKESGFPYKTYQGTIDGPGSQPLVFPAVFEGDFSVRASDVFARGGRSSAAVPPGGQPVAVKVQLTTTGTVEGRFLWSDGATPLPFGTVRLVSAGRVIGQQTTKGDDEEEVGSFQFDYVPAGPVRLEAEDPRSGRTGVAQGTLSAEGEVVTLDVVAYAVGRVEGDVTLNGGPAPGADVSLSSAGYSVKVTADAAGHYAVEGVPEGTVYAYADFGSGFLAGRSQGALSGEGSTLELPIALHGAATIEGTLLAADGVSPASVSLVSLRAAGARQSTTTDELGRFRFDLVPEGSVELIVEALQSLDCERQSLTLSAGQIATPTLALRGVGALEGTVTDAAGTVGGRVSVLGTGPGCSLTGWYLSVGPNGFFRIPELIAGSVTASFRTSTPGQPELRATGAGAVLPNETTTLDLHLEPSGRIQGLVVHEDGSPAIGSRLSITASGGRFAQVTSMVGGGFVAEGIPVGAVTIRVDDAWRSGVALLEDLAVVENETLDVGEIRLVETPLSVTLVSPVEDAVDVPLTEPIQIEFSAPIWSLGAYLVASGQHLGYTPSLSADRRIFTMTGHWPDSSEILVDVGTYFPATYDIYERRLPQPFRARFRTLDTSPPRVVTVTPANGAIQVDLSAAVVVTFHEEIVVEGDLSTLVRLSSAQGTVNGTVTSSGPDGLTFTPSEPLSPNLTYTVTVNGAEDRLGHVQTNAFTSTFTTPDSIPPVLRVLYPADGTWTNQRRPLIRAEVTDTLSGPDVSRGELHLDGQAVPLALAGNTLNYYPRIDLGDGMHAVTAAAYDLSGNRGQVSSSFQIDTQPPLAAVVTTPGADQVLSGVVDLAGHAEDDASGVARLSFLVDGYWTLDATAADGFQRAWQSGFATEGFHTVTAQATDLAWNAGPAGPAVRVIVNNKPLALAITAPAEAARFKTVVTVAAEPSEPVARMEFRAGAGPIVIDDTLPYEATLDLLTEPEGEVVLTVTAVGLAPETAAATRTIRVDRTPPPAPDFTRVHAEAEDGSTRVAGLPGAVEALALVKVTNPTRGAVVERLAFADGSFALRVAGVAGETLAITATDDAANESDPLAVTIEDAPTAEVNVPLEGLALWVRSGEGLTVDAEGRVSRWADQSGSGNDLVQTSIASQPSSGTDTGSGLAVLRFDGANDGLIFTTPLAASIRAVFAVLKESGGTGRRAFLGDADVNDFCSGAPALWYGSGCTSPSILGGQTWLNGVPVDGSTTARPTKMSVLSVVPTAGVSADRLFSSPLEWPWLGDIAELIIYTSPIAASQRKSVEDYLALKYAAYVATAGKPEFSPNGATFEESIEVSLSSPTPGAEIRYATDGSVPTETSTLYEGPLTLTETTTAHARAFRAGMSPSPVATASFTKASDFTPASVPGLALWTRSDVDVHADAAGRVYEWLDQSGAGNHLTQSVVASQPSLVLLPDAPNGLPVLCFDGTNDTMAFTARLEGSIRAVFAVLKESGGTGRRAFLGDADVNDFCSGAPALWYGSGCTSPSILGGATWLNGVPVDGATTPRPTTMSVLSVVPTAGVSADRLFSAPLEWPWLGDIAELIIYTSPITASQRKSVEDYLALKYAAYVATAGKPEFSPNGATFEESIEVSLSSPTPGAEIRYTTEDSEPTETSTLYEGPFLLTETTTVNARTFRAGMSPSAVATAAFTRREDFSPASVEGLALWTRADVGVHADSAGRVYEWADQSGEGNHLTQAVVASQPVLVPEALNGLPALRFDGTNDGLAFTTRLAGSIRAVFAVLKDNGGTAVRRAFLSDAGTREFCPGAPALWYGSGCTSPSILGGETRLNGALVNGATTPRPTTMSVLAVVPTAGVSADRLFTSPNDGWWQGDIAELIIYTSPITALQRKAVDSYLALKYAAYTPTANEPELSPNGATFEGSIQVSISSLTPGAEIRYTTDGSEPTETSFLYEGPLTLTETTLVQARTFHRDMHPSPVAATSFTRSPDFSPATIAGLGLWVRADAGMTTDASGQVESWRDFSGHGNDLTPSTSAAPPRFVSDDGQGRPVVHFDGVDDVLHFTRRLTAIRTVFWVIRRDPGMEAGYHFLLGDENEYNFHSGSTMQIWGSGANAAVRDGETRVNGLSVDGVTAERPQDLSVVSLVTTDNVRADAFSRDRWFGRSWWGDLAELIVYERPLEAWERKDVEDYLATKHQLYTPTLAAPVFTPNGSTVSVPVQVTIGGPPGSEVYYTTDGSEPSPAALRYVEPLLFTTRTTLKAQAFRVGSTPSSVTTATFLDTDTPAPLRFPGLRLWVKADAGIDAADGFVSTWADQSGNGNDLAQAIAAARPRYVAGDAEHPPVVRFDGVGDFLSFGSRLTTIRTVFWVIKRSESMTAGYRYLLGDSQKWDFCSGSAMQIWGSYASASVRNGETRIDGIVKDGITEARPLDLSVISLVTTGDTVASSISLQYSSAAYSWWGDLAELLIFDQPLADPDREAIEAYLAEKYGLFTPRVAAPAISPPGGAIAGVQLVQMDSGTPGAQIYYTLDDSEPTQASWLYTEPFEITGTTRIRAKAFRSGWNDSPESVVTFVGTETFTPASLPGLSLWVRSDAGLIYGGVARWPDQGPTRSDLEQTALNMCPRVVFDAESRMPLVNFDGSGDSLGFLGRLSTIRTVFWVIRRSPAMISGYRYLLGNVNSADFQSGSGLQLWGSYGSASVRNGETRVNGAIVNGLSAERPLDLSVISLVTTGNVVADAFSRDRTFGCSWWGDLGELVIYDRPLTPEERRSVEEYLAARYGIGLVE